MSSRPGASEGRSAAVLSLPPPHGPGPLRLALLQEGADAFPEVVEVAAVAELDVVLLVYLEGVAAEGFEEFALVRGDRVGRAAGEVTREGDGAVTELGVGDD